MAKISLYLDVRGLKPFEDAPVKLRISQGDTAALLSTGITIDRDLWDSKTSSVVGTSQAKTYNNHLNAMRLKAESILLDLRLSGKLPKMTANDIKRAVTLSMANEPMDKPPLLFVDAIRKARDAQGRKNSKDIYDLAVRYLQSYDPLLDSRTIDEADYNYIVGFDKYLSARNSRNSRNIYHRALRTAFNMAIDEERTTNYPYRRFKLRNEITRDKALSVEDLRRVLSCECDEIQTEYRDMFALSLYLIGINIGDLAGLKAVQSGRVEYKRNKTSKHYSIKVYPEAQAIIDRYRGDKYLLSIRDRYKDYKDYMHHLNASLKTLGQTRVNGKPYEGEPICSELSSGWARTTWATIATELDIPRETISAALGHSVVDVTATYIRLDMRKKVDAANRAVIDYVLNKKGEQ